MEEVFIIHQMELKDQVSGKWGKGLDGLEISSRLQQVNEK